ncbi:Lrp/AsnC family transcriptional regulator [Streptomyces mangrovisoli]|uniref:AsnC family transcriptional regulator n=1 Tax=Streptomyces mangrovisoli TaxID=1428628 RepID=A0A1J4P1Z8_9ACTN|nr:Lrp/AsnC family transcriptional regulator [Streptomyces mangrovisoli]OIJ68643.1 AsnC family transcriptional regulator [Streptomyces mangrovisoli]
MTEAVLDEVDYLLITALQHAPRADWRTVGALIGVDATTAARRWARLTGDGLAWLSCHPSPAVIGDRVVAFIEVDCVRGRLYEVCEQLADDAPLFNIEHATGARDLLLTAVLSSRAHLARYVGFRLGGLDGVAATRTQIATALHTEGSRWRLDRLHGAPQGAPHGAAREPAPAAAPAAVTLGAGDRELVMLLAQDVRQSVERLARAAGLSPTTVRRRLARLDAARAISYRCEAARSVSGWPVSATLLGTVPAADSARVVALLSAMRETRLCASLSGPCNLMTTVWLRSVDDIQPFEASLVKRVPGLEVKDRSVTLWQLKHAGQVLDPDGRLLRSVPLSDLWDDTGAGDAEAALLERLRSPSR